jgi:hypothetical protein
VAAQQGAVCLLQCTLVRCADVLQVVCGFCCHVSVTALPHWRALCGTVVLQLTCTVTNTFTYCYFDCYILLCMTSSDTHILPCWTRPWHTAANGELGCDGLLLSTCTHHRGATAPPVAVRVPGCGVPQCIASRFQPRWLAFKAGLGGSQLWYQTRTANMRPSLGLLCCRVSAHSTLVDRLPVDQAAQWGARLGLWHSLSVAHMLVLHGTMDYHSVKHLVDNTHIFSHVGVCRRRCVVVLCGVS